MKYVIFFFTLLGISFMSAASAENKGGGDRVIGEPYASRSVVLGTNGMAATSHPLASQIAIDILQSGGNAVDAAIAANAALGLMEPTGNGIGGDLFVILWDPTTEKLYGLNASGRSPLGQSMKDLKKRIGGDAADLQKCQGLAEIVQNLSGYREGCFHPPRQTQAPFKSRILP